MVQVLELNDAGMPSRTQHSSTRNHATVHPWSDNKLPQTMHKNARANQQNALFTSVLKSSCQSEDYLC